MKFFIIFFCIFKRHILYLQPEIRVISDYRGFHEANVFLEQQ